MSSVTIINSNTIIGIGAFGECEKLSITIPASLMTIDKSAFYGIKGERRVLKDNNIEYLLVKEKNKFGLCTANGGEIVPSELDALEQCGKGFLRYKLNGFWGVMDYSGKIIIDTDRGYTSIGDFKTFNKRFPYTMTGYKGECDINGRPISKIKVETPPQRPVVNGTMQQTQSDQQQGNGTQGRVHFSSCFI